MEKRSFIPFDAETFLMIEDVTGTEPEVTEKENYFELKMYAPDKEERIIEAAIYAVQGRYGKRIKDVRTIKEQNLLRGAIFFVEYEKGAENLPNELRANLGMPDETAGDIYCRRLLEVRALPVKRDNWEKLQIFTGGGTMQIPRTPGGLAVYSFPTENGVMLDVPEGNFIVLTPDGKFGKMDMQTFMANFEEKDANTAGLTFDEKSSQDAKHNYPDDCNICKDRFKCADFMRTQPIANLIQRFKTTTDKEGKTAIAGLLKQINADASGKPQNDIPEEVKEVAGKLAKAFGARVEIHRIEIPEKKRKFRKKPRKEQGNETRLKRK